MDTLNEAINKQASKERRRMLLVLVAVGLVVALLLFTYLNQPSGRGDEVRGVTIKVLYITPRLSSPYTSFAVKLDSGEEVIAEGPPNLPAKRNERIVLVKREKAITGGFAYEFSRYE